MFRSSLPRRREALTVGVFMAVGASARKKKAYAYISNVKFFRRMKIYLKGTCSFYFPWLAKKDGRQVSLALVRLYFSIEQRKRAFFQFLGHLRYPDPTLF